MLSSLKGKEDGAEGSAEMSARAVAEAASKASGALGGALEFPRHHSASLQSADSGEVSPVGLRV